MLRMGLLEEVVNSDYVWLCTCCGRCAQNCPAGIDIVPIMVHMRHLRERDKVPGTIHKGCMNNIETGNNLAITKEDYLQGMAELSQELAEDELPGFYVPVDKDGADIPVFSQLQGSLRGFRRPVLVVENLLCGSGKLDSPQ